MKHYSQKISCGLCLSLLGFITMNGCKKAVEVDLPSTFVVNATAFASDNSAFSAVSGIYVNMTNASFKLSGGNRSISSLTGLAGDELQYSSIAPFTDDYLMKFYLNQVPGTSTYFWNELYNNIYACNSALEGIQSSNGMSDSAKIQLTGTVKFMRAFFYFYAANLYGDVPLALTTNYRVNNSLSRSPVTQVYGQIIQDLKDAQRMLDDDYLQSMTVATLDRVIPNNQAATALLARVYLYTRDWQHAEEEASRVISDARYRMEPELNNVFLKNSTEAVWQLQTGWSAINTWDAFCFIIPAGTSPGSDRPSSLTINLLNAFENGDSRKTKWIGRSDVAASGTNPAVTYYFPYKYKAKSAPPITEYLTVLRLAEQYLIRSEARAQLGNIAGSAADLNIIRNRAGLPGIVALDKSALLSAVYHERQVELFAEWGHRWLDLKRTGIIDSVMTIVSTSKGTIWNTNAQLLPIPNGDIRLNPNLTQNPGY